MHQVLYDDAMSAVRAMDQAPFDLCPPEYASLGPAGHKQRLLSAALAAKNSAVRWVEDDCR